MTESNVLIVEDDPQVLRDLRNAIDGEPVMVESASTARTAIDLLHQKRFCGLVLDLVLDDGNGFDVLHYIERHQLRLPVVIVTHKLPNYVRDMLDEEHVKLVLPKPVEPRLLATVVLGLCGIRADQAEKMSPSAKDR